MKLARSSAAGSLLCIYALLHTALATSVAPIRRQQPTTTTPTTGPPNPTLTTRVAGQTTAAPSQEVTISSSASISSATHSSSRSVVPFVTSSITVNSTSFDGTIQEDELPLQPKITPGWAVAGVILLGTGLIYALIGIKTKWLHTFFSTAFLASLGTTVLIIYVMTPPVGDGIQGAYVAAVVCTGAILGGLAMVFKEVTECFGCLLGGFCLSMWMLTLQPGGLISTIGGRVGFIAAFTLAGFGLYFTKLTRIYGLIACLSFSGSTAAVLGIDCFTRAGLKEFWAYLWKLNDKLFLQGVESYPLTRGIRVELAVTVLIFLAGIISQLKLWRVIKQRKDKKKAEIAEGERNLREEEERVGRQIEETTARERRVWESVYADHSASQLGGSDDSGVADMGSEKRQERNSKAVSVSGTITTRAQSPTVTDFDTTRAESPITRAATPLSLAKALAAAEGAMIKEDDDERVVVVRVAEDDVADTAQDDVPIGARDMAGGPDVTTSPMHAAPHSTQVIPIVPLPFRVPDAQDDDERSSVATFADDDVHEMEINPTRNSKVDGLVRRLSNGSARLIRRLSQRSAQSRATKHDLAEDGHELLVETVRFAREETDSVIANMDEMSSLGEVVSARDSMASGKVDLVAEGDGDELLQDVHLPEETQASVPPGHDVKIKNEMPEKTASSSNPIDAVEPNNTNVDKQSPLGVGKAEENPSIGGDKTDQKMSTASGGAESVAASLTKGNLPSALSRVALSYRTNEWAKHLSLAEMPEPSSLETFPSQALSPSPEMDSSPVPVEEPAYVDVTELQQTAENATPPPAAPRAASSLSNYAAPPNMSRSNSRASHSGLAEVPEPEPLPQSRSTTPYRSSSGAIRLRNSALFAQPIAEEGDADSSNPRAARHSMSTLISQDLSHSASIPNIYGTPSPAATPFSSPPNTLMGMREAIIRNKTSYNYLAPAPSALDLPSHPRNSSDTDSLYNYPAPIDPDDLPLSQRRALIRQSSSNLNTRASRSSLLSMTALTPQAENTTFDSHQPLRRNNSNVRPEAVRQVQLANFRSSVMADLRQASGPVGGFEGQQLVGSASMGSLKNVYGGYGDAQMRAAEERRGREMEERMRSAEMIEAHREKLRRMQKGVGGL